MTEINIASMNTQGLHDYKKRRDVFQYFKQKKFSIIFLQDTHFEDKLEKQIRSEWGYEIYFSNYTSQARGVAILFNNNFDFKVKNVTKDNNGNFLIMTIETMLKELTLVCLYGPNRDSPEFYQDIQDKIINLQNPNVIFGGDWNLVLNPEKDYKNYLHINNPKAQDKVFELMAELNLVDVWREINPELQRFTWHRNNQAQHGRLDFFLVSDSFISFIKNAEIPIGYRTDHSMITLKLQINTETRFRNFWKFNSSLLKDIEFANEINNVIKEIKMQYAVPVYNYETIDNIPKNEIQFTISDQLFLDVLFMEIRKKCMDYGAKKKREDILNEQKLEKEILDLENIQNLSDEDKVLLNNKKENLVQMRKSKIDAILLRSKATYACQGEKITKYYCNMEKRHYLSKQMYKLINENEETLENTDDMLKETRTFYSNLYTKRPVEDIPIDSYVQNLPTLDDRDSNSLEGLITFEEATEALKSMGHNKSPGTDGISVEFLKFFWNKIGIFVVRSINDGFLKNEMSITQKEGIIVCIPKGDKPREFIKNWRPISLLNVTYKIASSCIANRIKTILPKLINEDQTGFISGRYIGDNLRLIYDLIHYLEEKNLPGLLLTLDFEKAFDSIDWSFMQKVLRSFGFKDDICQWISTFYSDIKSYVIVNGKPSQHFRIERGCRQGDPISPYLFILCAEVLACRIRENNVIKGINISDNEIKISQFADDTSLVLEGDENSYDALFKDLEKFNHISGLKLNYDKSCNVWLGSMKNSKKVYKPNVKMSWNPPKFKILGLWYTNDLTSMSELNFKEKMLETKKLFMIWSKRISTPLGRVAILKSLILSKLIYLWILLPNPPTHQINQLQKEILDFVWDKKPDKIKRINCMQTVELGGLGLPHVETYIKALKLTWLRKLLNDDNHVKWKLILNTYFDSMHKLREFGGAEHYENYTNPFWKDVFISYEILWDKVEVIKIDDFVAEPLFLNKKIKIDNKVIIWNKLHSNNILRIKDLMDDKGNILTLTQFQSKYNIHVSFINYFGITSAIKSYMHEHNITLHEEFKPEQIPLALRALIYHNKGAKQIYQSLLDKPKKSNALKNWEKLFTDGIPWVKVFIKTKKINEIKMKWFQLRINYRILVTNSTLKEMGIKQNNYCSFCHTEKDTIKHYLWDCPLTQIFWQQLEQLLKEKCDNCVRLKLNPILVLFSHDDTTTTDEGFDFIILQAKYFIYKCHIREMLPTINGYIEYLKYIYKVDKYMYSLNMSNNKFIKKWASYDAILR